MLFSGGPKHGGGGGGIEGGKEKFTQRKRVGRGELRAQKKQSFNANRLVEVDSERNRESAAPFTVQSFLDSIDEVEGEGLIK
jgi:hypothetical protein